MNNRRVLGGELNWKIGAWFTLKSVTKLAASRRVRRLVF